MTVFQWKHSNCTSWEENTRRDMTCKPMLMVMDLPRAQSKKRELKHCPEAGLLFHVESAVVLCQVHNLYPLKIFRGLSPLGQSCSFWASLSSRPTQICNLCFCATLYEHVWITWDSTCLGKKCCGISLWPLCAQCFSDRGNSTQCTMPKRNAAGLHQLKGNTHSQYS